MTKIKQIEALSRILLDLANGAEKLPESWRNDYQLSDYKAAMNAVGKEITKVCSGDTV